MNEATWIEKMRAVEGTLYHVVAFLNDHTKQTS